MRQKGFRANRFVQTSFPSIYATPPPARIQSTDVVLAESLALLLVHALYDAYAYWNGVLEKFPKTQRHVLGATCSQYLLAILELTFAGAQITDPNGKIAELRKASVKLDALKLLVRLSKDCRCVSNSVYLQMESRLQKIGKMLGGWMKSLG